MTMPETYSPSKTSAKQRKKAAATGSASRQQVCLKMEPTAYMTRSRPNTARYVTLPMSPQQWQPSTVMALPAARTMRRLRVRGCSAPRNIRSTPSSAISRSKAVWTMTWYSPWLSNTPRVARPIRWVSSAPTMPATRNRRSW